MPEIQCLVFKVKTLFCACFFKNHLHPFRTSARNGSAIIIGKTDIYKQYQNIQLWPDATILCLTRTLTCANPLRDSEEKR